VAERPRTPLWVVVWLLVALLVGGWFLLPGVQHTHVKKSKAHLGAKALAMAIDVYVNNPSSMDIAFPTSLNDLLHSPAHEGRSLLRNGIGDLLDPWGQPYQMRRAQRADGREYAIVFTTAPDGTPISQFGIGEAATPKW
jgi:hypothetical protein